MKKLGRSVVLYLAGKAVVATILTLLFGLKVGLLAIVWWMTLDAAYAFGEVSVATRLRMLTSENERLWRDLSISRDRNFQLVQDLNRYRMAELHRNYSGVTNQKVN